MEQTMEHIRIVVNPKYFRRISLLFEKQTINMFEEVRRYIFFTFGIRIPEVRIEFSSSSPNNEIKIVYKDLESISFPGISADEFAVITTRDFFVKHGAIFSEFRKFPESNKSVFVVTQEVGEAIKGQIGLWTPISYFNILLNEFVIKHLSAFIDTSVIKNELDELSKTHPNLVKIIVDQIDLPQVTAICKNLADDRISIANLPVILEAMIQFETIVEENISKIVFDERVAIESPEQQDEMEILYSFVRRNLKNEISYYGSQMTWNLNAILLDELPEKIVPLAEITKQMENRFVINAQNLIEKMEQNLEHLSFLSSSTFRSKIRSITKYKFPHIPVIAYEELHPSVSINTLGKIGFLTILLAFFFGINGNINAQSALFNSTIDAYNLHINNAQLAQNDGALLPIGKLDKRTMNAVTIGFEPKEKLFNFMARYLPINYMSEDQLARFQSATPDNEMKKETFVIVIGDAQMADVLKEKVIEIIGQYETIVVLRDLETYTTIPNIVNAASIIHLFNDDDISLDLLSQQLFGGAPLNKSAMTDDAGNDLNTSNRDLKGDISLGFAPPEYVGIDGQKMNTAIDAIANEGIDSAAYPGCQILVARHGKVIFQKTYGYHTYDNKRPVLETDLYDLASITKVSSATLALMKLNGEGLFDLDAPLKKYFPSFSNSNKADLTWRQILAHNARLQAWIPFHMTTKKPNGKFKRKTLKTKFKKNYPIKLTDHLYLHKNYKQRIYEMIKESPLNEQPGYLYSGLTFYLYPEIVEKLTGQPFENYLKDNIYHKIGAYSITYNPLRFYPLDQIIPTEKDTFFRMVQLQGIVHDEGAAMMNGVSSNAGLFSTTLDLAKLMQMLLQKGSYADAQILKPEVVSEFTRCQYCDEGNRRGLGFEKPMIEYDEEKSHVAKAVSKSSFGHSGYTGTFAWVDPEYDLVYIFMSNRVYPTRLNRKLYSMNIRPRIQAAIYDAMID